LAQLPYIPLESDHTFATTISKQEMEMFNSLRYTKVLEEAGVVRKQAEAHVGIMTDMMASHFATSNDLKDLRNELSQDIKDLRNEISLDMKSFRHDLNNMNQEMQKLEYRLTIKLGTIVGALLGVTATIVTLVIKLA